jgi:hypothetical protein
LIPPPKAARLAAVLSLLCALGVIAAAGIGSTLFAMIGGAAAALATVAVLIALSKPEPAPLPVSTPQAPPTERPSRKAAETSVLLATLRNPAGGFERVVSDLQRVLAGIVADERGDLERTDAQSLSASFTRNDHAGAAVHAAQRMLSNVDAVSRRLGHDLKIAIGVHSGIRGDDMDEVARVVQSAATDSVPVLVSEGAARHLKGALERVDTLRGEGRSLDVFTFPPAQKRLPGF